MEQVLVLLAQHAEQLAQLVAADLDKFRNAITRFLELSPDIRKSALSLGLDPNERCLACRTVQRKLILDPMVGTDNVSYQPENPNSAAEQAKRLIIDSLRFPTKLMTGLAAG